MCKNSTYNFIYKMGTADKLGSVVCEEGITFTSIIDNKNTKLCIFNEKDDLIAYVRLEDYKINDNLASVYIKGLDAAKISYLYEVDGKYIKDPFIMDSVGVRKYKEINNKPIKAKVYNSDFDWEGDRTLGTSLNDIIAYQLHVRGYTAHSSSKVKNRGKYLGLIEKIPYLLELGINQIILMPTYEFNEYEEKTNKSLEYLDYTKELDAANDNKPTLNYWGFKEGAYFMPKLSYANKNAVLEFKEMVKAFHKAGIEIIMRFYFPDSYNKSIICDVLKFWYKEYHIDGFYLMGSDIPMDLIAADLILRDAKIYTGYFDKASIVNKTYGYNHNVAIADKEYSICMRKYLKSDEDMLQSFLYRQRHNPSDIHSLNYITDYAGFTLNDLVSYDYKHNENNLEDNKDGENYNYSWNCGFEGYTKKKSVLFLRLKQIKNAFTFLMMSQGIPMILAGDEFLNSQNGNNNAYCQDNEIGWTIWKDTAHSKEIVNYVKALISYRKSHPVLRPNSEYRIMDYAACGYPDLSYHGEQAWAPRFDNHLRNIGVMICGKYARIDRLNNDDFFYIAYNMHWENHTFGLPKLPKGLCWDKVMSTDDNNLEIVTDENQNNNYSITVKGRSIAIIKSMKIVDKVDKED